MDVKWILVNSTADRLGQEIQPRDSIGPFETVEEAQAFWTDHTPHKSVLIVPIYTPEEFRNYQSEKY